MLVAVCDQNFGNSTSFCSNAGPFLPGIVASRISHSTSSNGARPGIVKYRRTPRCAAASITSFVISVSCASTAAASFALAMCAPPDRSVPAKELGAGP